MSATTNFQVWNPNQVNQDSDSAYTSDSLRTGGAVDGDVFEAVLANKLFYQVSTMVAALGTMLADKGFTNSDSNFNQLVSVLSNIVTTADQKQPLLVVSPGASLTFDCSKADGFQVTLNASVTSSTVENASPGQIVTFVLIQDGTGGHTFAWPASITGTTAIDATANITNVQSFIARADGTLRPLTPLLNN
ncbi:MAG TPA: hypothetical protein VGM02_01450 [Acidobacteriaceae bacterium]|jgi:hypothetical protein